MGAGEPPTLWWPSSVLWMSPLISRAFLSRLRASLASLYNPDATIRSLLCFLCFTADVVVFACRPEIHHHSLALGSIGLMVEFA
jgi:hypothetical protein